MEHFKLHILGKGRAQALDIELVGAQAAGLNEELVAGLLGKAVDLGLNGGTVPGTHALDGAVEKRAAGKILADNLVSFLVGIGEIAAGSVLGRLIGGEGKGLGILVAGLHLHLVKVHAAGIDPGRRTGLKAAHPKPHCLQAFGEKESRVHAVGA